MLSRLRSLERINITQRQAVLAVLALYFLGSALVALHQLIKPAVDGGVYISGGSIGAMVFGGAWVLYYTRNWDPARYLAVSASALVVGASLPEPFVSQYAPMAILIPVVLALILAGPFGVIANAILTMGLLLVRAGGSGVYASPITLIIYAMIVGGMLVSRLIARTSLRQFKQAEQRYRLLFEENPLPMWLYNVDSLRFLAVNEAAVAHYGYARDEFLRMTIKDIRPPEELSRLEANLSGPHQAQERSGPWKHRKKDGSLIDVDIISHDTLFLGQPARLVLVNDITERKRADDSLAATERRFRALSENAPDGITVVDAKGTVIYVSPSIERILGYSPAEALGRAAIEYVHPEDRSHLLEELARLIQKPGQALLQYRFRHKDGSWRWLESMVSNLLAESSIQGIVFNYRDVTERRQAEEKLRLSDQILERVHALVMVADREGSIVYMSPEARTILGYEPEELLGDGWWNMSRSDPAEARREKEYVARAARGEIAIDVTPYERPIRHRSGEIHWIEWVDVIGPNGLLIGIGHDVTGRKQAQQKSERQLQRLSALHAIDVAVSNTFDMRLSLAAILKETMSQLEVDAAAILLFNQPLLTLEYAAGSGFRSSAIQQARLRIGEGAAGRAAAQRRIIHIPNLAQAGVDFGSAELIMNEAFVAYYAVPLIVKAELKGVLEIFHRAELHPDQEWLDFLATLAGQAALAIDSGQLFENLERSNIEISLAYDATIEGWSRAMDLRDKETEGHTQRVTEQTLKLAQSMNMSESDMMHIRRGALLHDIGKLGVPDNILLKTDKLTDAEWKKMREHPRFAYDMLREIRYLKPALDIPYCHHEKWDGSGYPRGLKGEEIPLVARIFAVVDVWDAVTSDRPYRPAWSRAQAVEHIRAESGKHFDPQVVKAFLNLVGTT
jgi:PAS domain S-box-containing protein